MALRFEACVEERAGTQSSLIRLRPIVKSKNKKVRTANEELKLKTDN
jgi:hypothetical protein